MSTYSYPYDPSGENPACMVRDESHDLSIYYNKWHCIIPLNAPFYREDLDLRDGETGRKLVEGMDYFLGHRFAEATTENKRPIYGSVMLNYYDKTKSVEFKQYRTLGGKFIVPRSEVLKYLATDFIDPRNCDWSELMKYAVPVPPKDPSENLEEAIANDPVVHSLDELRKAIIKAQADGQEAYDDFINLITPLEAKIEQWRFAYHQHERGPALHGVTLGNSNCIAFDASTDDSMKAYAKTLSELTAIINSINITQDDLDNYAKLTGDTIFGNLHLSSTDLALKNPNGASTVDLRNGSIRMVTKGNIELDAVINNDDNGAAVQLIAGRNGINVHATNAARDDNACTYNGFYVLHLGNYEKYLPKIDMDSLIMRTESTDKIKLYGLGISSSPLYGDVIFTQATSNVAGVHRLGQGNVGGRTDVAASAAFAKQIADRVNSFALKTTRVNGQPLSGNIVIDANKLGLGEVDNTPDLQKPVSTKGQQAINNKSPEGHTHTMADVTNIRYASLVEKGLFQLVEDINYAHDDRALVPASYYQGHTNAEDAKVRVDQLLPIDVIDVMQYGGFGYLPLPVLGSYEGSGPNYSARECAGFIDPDNTLIIYRNGSDIEASGVYYASARVLPNGAMDRYSPSATRYRPKQIDNNNYIVNRAYRGSKDGMGINVSKKDGSDSHYCLVLFNGTGDESRHNTARFTTDNFTYSGSMIPVVIGDMVYIILSDVNQSWAGVKIWTVPVAEVRKGGVITPTLFTCTGKTFFNNPLTPDADDGWHKLCRGGLHDAPYDGECIILREDTSQGINVRHNGFDIEIGTNGNLIRIYNHCHTYDWDAKGSGSCAYSFSYVIDVAAKTITPDAGNTLPIVYKRRGVYVGACVTDYGQSNPLRTFNTFCGTAYNDELEVAWATYNDYTPKIVGFTRNGNKSRWDNLNARARGVTRSGNEYGLNGNFGSISTNPAYSYTPVPGNRSYLISGSSQLNEFVPNATIAGKKANGPTTNRVVNGDWDKYRRSIYFTDGVREYMSGAVFYDGKLSHYKRLDNNLNAVGSVSISQATFDAVKNKAIDILNAKIPDTDLRSSSAQLQTRMVITHPDEGNIPAIVQLTAQFKDPDGTNHQHDCAIALDRKVPNGEITYNVNNAVYITHRHVSSSAVSIATPNNGQNSAAIYYDATAKAAFIALSFGPAHSQIGSGPNSFGMSVIYDVDTNAFSSPNAYTQASYRCSGCTVDKNYGVCWLSDNSGRTAILGASKGKTKAEWVAGNTIETVILHTSKVATGWIIYFTEDMPYFIDKKEHMVTKTEIDLRVKYPTAHANSTFYIYVELDRATGTVGYSISKELMVDSDSRLYIGECRTDSQRITKLEVAAATRLGEFREISDHNASPFAHGMDTFTGAKLGLEYTTNRSELTSVHMLSMTDWFNRCYKTSHGANGKYPSVSADTTGWSISGDTIKYMPNTTSAAMLLSNDKVCGYEFEATISSSSNDDDYIGLVLAYNKVGSVEHTITALCHTKMTGTDDHFTQVDVYYNYGQVSQELITSLGGEVTGSWSDNGEVTMNVIGKIDGTYSLTCSNFTGKPDVASVSEDIDISNMPYKQYFASSRHYGFCVHGQASANWKVKKLPYYDTSAYYASMELAEQVVDKLDKGTVVLSGYAAHGSVLPVPAGFTVDECQFYVTIDELDTGDRNDPIDGWNCSVSSSRVVTCQVKKESAGSGGAMMNRTAKYVIIGVKQ